MLPLERYALKKKMQFLKLNALIGSQSLSSKNPSPCTTHIYVPTYSPTQRFVICHVSNVSYNFI
jgi:hypothetical protein